MRNRKYKCVVPVSGGKDSQACLKMAINDFGAKNVLGLFCDTKFEHWKTYRHIEAMRKLYGVKIVRICAGSVYDKVIKHGRFPGGGARHCTDELKIKPSKKFYKALAEKQGGFQVYYGMRFDESSERAKRYEFKVHDALYPPHEIMADYPKYLFKMGVTFRLPVLEWAKWEVFDYLQGEENPLYADGFDRVGCFPCLAGGDAWKEKAFAYDATGDRHKKMAMELEQITGKSVFTSKGGCQRNNPAQIGIFDGPGCAVCAI